MPFRLRPFALMAVCGLAVLCTACSSKNKGKIEGKWKLVSAPGFDDSAKMLEKMELYPYIEFKPDGSLVFGADSPNPMLKETIAKEMAKKLGDTNGKYKLQSGEWVEFSGLNNQKETGGLFGKKDKDRVRVVIEGDQMTILADDGVVRLVRLK